MFRLARWRKKINPEPSSMLQFSKVKQGCGFSTDHHFYEYFFIKQG